MALIDTIGRALGGFGAGVAGKGSEYLQQLSEDRKNAMLEDALRVEDLLTSGDVSKARELVLDRIKNIQRLGGNPDDSMAFLKLLDAGDVQTAITEARSLVDYGVSQGRIKRPQPQVSDWKFNQYTGTYGRTNPLTGAFETRPLDEQEQKAFDTWSAANLPKNYQISGGQIIKVDPGTGAATATDITGYKPDPEAEKDRQLRARSLDIQERSLDNRIGGISAGLEKYLIETQDAAQSALQVASTYETLADDYSRAALSGGVGASYSEYVKNFFGNQDDESEFRRRFRQVRTSEMLRNLPSGAASDVDVQNALQGLPPDNASPDYVVSFLRGAAKLARLEAEYNRFKSDYIDQYGDVRGMLRAWDDYKENLYSNQPPAQTRGAGAPAAPTAGGSPTPPNAGGSPTYMMRTKDGSMREVTQSEIDAEAKRYGITPEQVISDLGLQRK